MKYHVLIFYFKHLSNLFGSKPKFEHPLITGCQGFRMDRPDCCLAGLEEHELFGQSEDRVIIENSSLLGPEVPRSSEGRRDFFSRRENLQKYYFETDYIYTFEFYCNFFSPTRFRFEITPFFSFDLIPKSGNILASLKSCKSIKIKVYQFINLKQHFLFGTVNNEGLQRSCTWLSF